MITQNYLHGEAIDQVQEAAIDTADAADLAEEISKGVVAPENVRAFLLAGDCVATVENTATGGRFTYRIKGAPSNRDPNSSKGKVWWVSLLSGPDNLSDYTYLGSIFDGATPHYTLTGKSKVTSKAPSHVAFDWLFNKHVAINRPLPPTVNVYHMGRCGRCGRALTVPESIRTGLGPICANKE